MSDTLAPQVENAAPLGTIRISPQVLATIVSLTALSVEGVAHLGSGARSVNFSRNVAHGGDGVRVRVQNGSVSAEVYVVVKDGVSMQKVGNTVQKQVSEALDKMVGMPVASVNVYIEDVEG